jgi:hypothetical protein
MPSWFNIPRRCSAYRSSSATIEQSSSPTSLNADSPLAIGYILSCPLSSSVTRWLVCPAGGCSWADGQSCFNLIGGLFWRDVFPDADHPPARGSERCVGGSVALDVASEFRRPVPLVVCRLATVLGADVPEAPVHEDGYAAPREDEVGAYPGVRQIEPVVLPKPPTPPVQEGAQSDLRLGVAPADGGQVPSAAGGDR